MDPGSQCPIRAFWHRPGEPWSLKKRSVPSQQHLAASPPAWAPAWLGRKSCTAYLRLPQPVPASTKPSVRLREVQLQTGSPSSHSGPAWQPNFRLPWRHCRASYCERCCVHWMQLAILPPSHCPQAWPHGYRFRYRGCAYRRHCEIRCLPFRGEPGPCAGRRCAPHPPRKRYGCDHENPCCETDLHCAPLRFAVCWDEKWAAGCAVWEPPA